MSRDYSTPILPGSGETDYERYMQTDVLLSLQKRPEQMAHRDELLFQIVHQSTELWLKHACYELSEAADLIDKDDVDGAIWLIGRACLGVRLVTGQLDMLCTLRPFEYQSIRPALGNGSGFESPGWKAVNRVSKTLARSFDALLDRKGLRLIDIYRGDPGAPVFRLCEALVDWDEEVALWRTRHYKVATRIVGHGVLGTKGMPVDKLPNLISHKFFPELWHVRTELTLDASGIEASDSE